MTNGVFKKTLLGLVLVTLGFGIGWAIGVEHEQSILFKDLNVIHPLRDHNSTYKFISPLLAYVIPSADQETGLTTLKNKISNFIDQEKSHGLTDASMYFYDLNRGRWIGVNQQQKYNPASILKVVIMVSYFKESETNPEVLKNNLTYAKSIDDIVKKDTFNSPSELRVGNSYSTESLIEEMIVNSDNGAEILLLNNIDRNSLDAIYSALNIDSPDKVSGDFTISPRAYSLFFRIIYSATYLDRQLSEKALDILSKTTFDDGIVAGLPVNVVVSHKFGEYVASNSNQIQSIELHDCGIVYYPSNPYFLCIMTKGNNVDELKSVIKNISSVVYQNYNNVK